MCQSAHWFAVRLVEPAETHLCIEADEDIPPVSVESRDAYTEVRFWFLQWLAVGRLGGLGRYEARFRLPVNLGLLSPWSGPYPSICAVANARVDSRDLGGGPNERWREVCGGVGCRRPWCVAMGVREGRKRIVECRRHYLPKINRGELCPTSSPFVTTFPPYFPRPQADALDETFVALFAAIDRLHNGRTFKFPLRVWSKPIANMWHLHPVSRFKHTLCLLLIRQTRFPSHSVRVKKNCNEPEKNDVLLLVTTSIQYEYAAGN